MFKLSNSNILNFAFIIHATNIYGILQCSGKKARHCHLKEMKYSPVLKEFTHNSIKRTKLLLV